jgi:hypothetical protein
LLFSFAIVYYLTVHFKISASHKHLLLTCLPQASVLDLFPMHAQLMIMFSIIS